MDPIRKQQIAEVLNEHNDINAMVMKFERENVDKTAENVLPYNQIDTETVENVATNVASLATLLERKQAVIHAFNFKLVDTGASKLNKYVEAYQELTQYEEVLRLYNLSVKTYFDISITNTQFTKSEVLSKMRKLLPQLNYIVKGIKHFIDGLINNGSDDQKRKFFVQWSESYICYKTLYEYIMSGNLHPISRSDLANLIEEGIKNIREIRDVFQQLNLKSTFSTSGDPFFGTPPPPPPPPPGGAPGGAPPGGAPPGGAPGGGPEHFDIGDAEFQDPMDDDDDYMSKMGEAL